MPGIVVAVVISYAVVALFNFYFVAKYLYDYACDITMKNVSPSIYIHTLLIVIAIIRIVTILKGWFDANA